MAISDADDKQLFSQHASLAMAKHYYYSIPDAPSYHPTSKQLISNMTDLGYSTLQMREEDPLGENNLAKILTSSSYT